MDGFQQVSPLHFNAVCPTEDSPADLDFYQVSLENRRLFFNGDDLLDILIGLCGEMVTLSSSSNSRSGAEKNIPGDHLILAYHPVIISTYNSPSLKSSIISSSTALGYPCFPDGSTRTLVRGTRPIPTKQFREVLHDAGVGALTLTNYGMKVPLSSSVLYQKSSVLEAWSPFSSNYPPNSFDISFTIRSDTLYTIRLLPAPGLTRYTLFTPLDFRPHPTFNHGGSFKQIYHTSPPPHQTSTILSLSCYSPLHHFLIQSTSSSRTLQAPVSIRNGQKRLDTFQEIYTLLLTQPPSLLGGLRHELRVAAITPQRALEKVHEQRSYDILPLHPDIFSLSVADYLIAVPQLLDMAKEELTSLGFTFSHRPLPPNATVTCTDPQRQIFGDIRRLFGETCLPSYCTDPILPTAWWRRRTLIANYIPLPPIVLPPAAPAPAQPLGILPATTDEEFAALLWGAISSSLYSTRTGKRVRWSNVSFLLSATHPNLSCAQLRSRALVMRRAGKFADWTQI